MKDLPTTAVYLTDEECLQFANFQKHRELFDILVKLQGFDVRGGMLRIHFGSDGRIHSVDKQEFFKFPFDF